MENKKEEGYYKHSQQCIDDDFVFPVKTVGV